MGSSVSLYMGPYLKIRNEKIEEMVSVRACLNNECGRKLTESKDKFCARCGSPIVEAQVPQKKDKLNTYEITEKYNDQLYSCSHLELKNGYEVLLPNIYTPEGMRDFSLGADYDSEFIEDFDKQIKPEEEIAWFKKQFQNEIEAFQEQLKEVTVGWGFIRYWS